MASLADTVLLIVGHGAADAPTAADAVTSHARNIASREIFADVRSGFLRQEPFAKSVLDQIGGRSVVVVPHFAADGYIAGEVLPGELGIGDGTALTKAVGSHPNIPAVAADLVLTEARDAGIDPGGTDIVVVGHGTGRNDRSETSTARLAELVLAETGAASCTAAFLEIDPLIEDWREFTSRPHVVVLPNLFAAGFHGAEDIPARLGAPGKRQLHLCPPLGTAPVMADLIVDRALSCLAQTGETAPA